MIDTMENDMKHLPTNDKTKKPNLFETCYLQPSHKEPYSEFYTRFRTSICHHLKKSGSTIRYLDNETLSCDEMISPTFEEIIILWCLEKIDHKLPGKDSLFCPRFYLCPRLLLCLF